MKIKKMFWLLFLPILLVSCWDVDDYKDFGIEPTAQSWVLPVLNSTITFKEVVERSGSNTVVEEDPSTGVFFMAFRDTLNFASATDQFQLMGATFPFTVNQSLVSGFGQINVQEDLTQAYQIINGAEIKLIDFLSGSMILEMQNNYHHKVSGTLTITSLEKNQEVYTKDFNLQAFSSSLSDTRPLDDYTLLLYDEIGDAYNTFMVTLNISIDENVSAPDYSGNLSINIGFDNPDYELIQGKVNETLSITDQTYQLSAFNSTFFAEQHFAEPYFSFTVENSYGLPVGFTFTSFEACTINNDVFPIVNEGASGPGGLDLSGVNNIEFLQSPSEAVAKTELELNKDNSNIENAFDNAPNRLNFGLDFILGDASHERFIKRNSEVTFISDMVLPLYGWAKTHEIRDTIMDIAWFDINTDIDFLNIDDFTVTLKFKTTNEMPLDVYLQMLTLKDVEGDLIPDYYFFVDKETGLPENEKLAKSAILDANGISVDSNVEYLSITLTQEEYEQIVDSDHLILQYRLVTGGGQADVKILSTNRLQLQMSMIVSGTVQVEF
ncbi:MAG: hypothetical protein PHE03_11810 [Bacteroidales bacterium]|nr:hypothetical protein [Bacteroidales bacterium]MDD3892975.1 hypothetical protein [Bacteroidales bacterium]